MNAHASARERWLAHARRALDAAEHVAAVELVGSLGRGDGDNWSDVDLLVFVHGDVRTALDALLPQVGEVALQLDAPNNTRADGHSFGAIFLVDELPLATDWYVWPAALAGGSFAELNAHGPRGEMPPITDSRQRALEVAMTVVEAKRLVRGVGTVPLEELRRRATLAPEPALGDAINRYLDLVEASM
jgi:hypothetical protein